mgnify:CR=1 FL=1
MCFLVFLFLVLWLPAVVVVMMLRKERKEDKRAQSFECFGEIKEIKDFGLIFLNCLPKEAP